MVHPGFPHCVRTLNLMKAAKKSYFKLMNKPIANLLNPSYEGEVKRAKLQFMLKLTYDTIFYSLATVISYLTFR